MIGFYHLSARDYPNSLLQIAAIYRPIAHRQCWARGACAVASSAVDSVGTKINVNQQGNKAISSSAGCLKCQPLDARSPLSAVVTVR